MKKTILTTLIAAGISTAPLANELAKLSFATDNSAQTPTQKIAVQEKTAQTSASSKTEGADTIPERIFDQTDNRQLAVLTPDEMAETEGATIEHGPGGFGFGPVTASEGATMFSRSVVGSVAKGAAKQFAVGAGVTQGLHFIAHGEPADLTTTMIGGVIQAGTAARAAYPAFVGTTIPKTGYPAYVAVRNGVMVNAATYPWVAASPSNTPSPVSPTANEQKAYDPRVTQKVDHRSFDSFYTVEIPKKPEAVSHFYKPTPTPSWRDNFVEARNHIDSPITKNPPITNHSNWWGSNAGDR